MAKLNNNYDKMTHDIMLTLLATNGQKKLEIIKLENISKNLLTNGHE